MAVADVIWLCDERTACLDLGDSSETLETCERRVVTVQEMPGILLVEHWQFLKSPYRREEEYQGEMSRRRAV